MRLTLRELRSYIINETSEVDVSKLAQMCLNGDRESFLVLSDAEEEAGIPLPETFFERLTHVVDIAGDSQSFGAMPNPPPWSSRRDGLVAFPVFGVTFQFSADFLRHEQGSIAVDVPWNPTENMYVGHITSFRSDEPLQDKEGPFFDTSNPREPHAKLMTMWSMKPDSIGALGAPGSDLQGFGPNDPEYARMNTYIDSMLKPVATMRDRLIAALK